MTHRKYSTRLSAILLALVIMMTACSLSLVAFAVGEEDDGLESVENLNIKHYMHFGDSMSTGYMLGASQQEINASPLANSAFMHTGQT